MDKPIVELITEHILEIRYQPNSNILDYRGILANSISKHMELSEWRIDENRVDVYSKDQLIKVFVSFRNAGVVIRDTTESDYFANKASKYIRFLFSQKPMPDSISAGRIGVRSRFAVSSPIPFTKLVDQFQQRIFNISDAAMKAFDARLIDVGAPLNFETKNGKINTQSGPMEKEQLSGFFDFKDKDSLPNCALYFDFDYWTRPGEPLVVKNIPSLIKLYSHENWERFTRLRSLILGN